MIKEINSKEVRKHLVSAKKLDDFKKWQVIYLSSFFEVDNHFISLITGFNTRTIADIMRKYRKPAKERPIEKRINRVKFNERELHLIRLICMGKTSLEIGEEMGLATRTVEGYRMGLYAKLEITRLAELVVFAVKHKLI